MGENSGTRTKELSEILVETLRVRAQKTDERPRDGAFARAGQIVVATRLRSIPFHQRPAVANEHVPTTGKPDWSLAPETLLGMRGVLGTYMSTQVADR